MLPLRLLFRSFAFLLGLLYLGSVCELDATKARQNFAHESHEYVTAAPTVEVPAPAPQPDAPAVVLVAGPIPAPCPAFVGQRGKVSAWPWAANPPPPRCAGSTCATPCYKSDLRV